MYIWTLAGVVLGILLSCLVRAISRSSLAEMTYLTFLSIADRRRNRSAPDPLDQSKPQHQTSSPLRAAAGRISML